jgi:hypothetical protein
MSMLDVAKKKLSLRGCNKPKIIRASVPSKHPQRVQQAIQDAALNEIMENRAANGGIVDYGIIQKTINKYNADGYDFVNRNAVDYCRRLRTLGFLMNPTANRKKMKAVEVIALEDVQVPIEELKVNDNETVISPITEPDEMIVDLSSPGTDVGSRDKGSGQPTTTTGNFSHSKGHKQKRVLKKKVTKNSNTKNKNKAKRVRKRKVKANTKKKILEAKIAKALTKAAIELRNAQIAAVKTVSKKVPSGTLLSIVKRIEEKLELHTGSVSKSTIIKRCQRNNPPRSKMSTERTSTQ